MSGEKGKPSGDPGGFSFLMDLRFLIIHHSPGLFLSVRLPVSLFASTDYFDAVSLGETAQTFPN
jgi:hypothetical protein